MSGLRTRRAMVLVAMQPTSTTPTFNAATDAILVENPDVKVDLTILERSIFRPSISQMPHVAGRKIYKTSFRTELRGGGTAGTAARIGRLFRACGYSETVIAAAAADAVRSIGTPVSNCTWATTGILTPAERIAYTVTVTTPGASGTAKVSITPDNGDAPQLNQTVTTGTPILVAYGLSITPTLTGSMTGGDSWLVVVRSPGVQYDPVSTGNEQIALQVFFDGTMHLITLAQGTFKLTADGGKYPYIDWEFTGTFNTLVDSAMPSPTYETTIPAQVALARVYLDGFQPNMNSFTFDQGNTLGIRDSVNNADAFNGVVITDRKCMGGIDPEADLVANQDFWSKLASSKTMFFQQRFGVTAGNVVWFESYSAQATGLTYKDRTGIRTYDEGLRFSSSQGDNEARFYFC